MMREQRRPRRLLLLGIAPALAAASLATLPGCSLFHSLPGLRVPGVPGAGNLPGAGHLPGVPGVSGIAGVSGLVGAAASGNVNGVLQQALPGIVALAVPAVALAATAAVNAIRDRAAQAREEKKQKLEATQSYYAGQCTLPDPATAGSAKAPQAGPAQGDDPRALGMQADAFFAMGDATRAEQTWQRVVQAEERQKKPDPLVLANALNKLAALHHAQSDFGPAEMYGKRALQLRKDRLGDANLDVAESMNTLARIYKATGNYPQAEPLYVQALEVRKKALKTEDHVCVAQSLNDLANLYLAKGTYSTAEPLYRRALEIRVAKLGKEHRDVAQSQTDLAGLYKAMGDYSDADKLYQRALQNRQARLKDDPQNLEFAESYQDLGVLYQAEGDYLRAEPLYKQALSIRQARLPASDPGIADSVSALAGLYQLMGDLDHAEPLLQSALKSREARLGADHPDVARSLNDLADLYLARGDFARAEPNYQRALQIRERRLGPAHPDVAESLSSLGTMYQAKSDFARAEPSYQRALQIRRAALGPDHPEVARALHRLGALYQARGDYGRAEGLYNEALQIRKNPAKFNPDHPDLAESLIALSTLAAATGHPDKAVPLLRQSLVISEKLLRGIGKAGSESRLESFLRTLRLQEEIIYSLVSEPKAPPEAGQLALTTALLRKGRSVDQAAATSRALFQTLADPGDRAKLELLRKMRSDRVALAMNRPASLSDMQYQDLLKGLKDETEKLEGDLRQRSPVFRAQQSPEPDTVIAQVAGALPRDGALVEIVAFQKYNFRATPQKPLRGEVTYLGMVLLPDGKVGTAGLGPGDRIDGAVTRVLKAFTEDKSDYVGAATEMGQLAIAPLYPLLGEQKNLFLSLDGQLNLVPFGALHDDKGFLLDRYRMIYLTSGRDLLRADKDLPRGTKVALVANPRFVSGADAPRQHHGASQQRGLKLVEAEVPEAGADRSAEAKDLGEDTRGLRTDLLLAELPSLPFTQKEAAAILKILPRAQIETVLTDEEATKDALLRLSAPGILHVATHGRFKPESSGTSATRGLKLVGTAQGQPSARVAPQDDPLLHSALLLSGAGVPARYRGNPVVQLQPDGLATALEVAGMNLWGTQLVVLSACETGRGDVKLGQGVYGLRRAVMVAGAETLVTSLWQINDKVTRELMGRYYGNLLAGQGRVEAMNEAAQHIRKRHPHPYYWAPFITIGRGEPLQGFARPVHHKHNRSE